MYERLGDLDAKLYARSRSRTYEKGTRSMEVYIDRFGEIRQELFSTDECDP